MTLPLSKIGRRYGYKQDTPDENDLGLVSMRPIQQKAIAPATATVTSVNLEPWLGPVRDQGSFGSCTAHAGTCLREFLYRKYNNWETKKSEVAPEAAVFSPLYLYYRLRQIEGSLPLDDGCQMRTIGKALRKFGSCLQTEDVFREQNFNLLPTVDQAEHAYLFHSGSYHRIGDVDSMKSCLSSGYVALIGIKVFESFESPEVEKTGLVPMPKSNEMVLGGHATTLVGFNDSVQCPRATPGAFLVRNSWGKDWGRNGDFWLPYAFAADRNLLMDCWTAHLGPAWG